MGEYDEYLAIDEMEFVVLIKGTMGNILKVNEKRFFFNEWLPKESFIRGREAKLSKVQIQGVDYYFDYRNQELRMI